MQAKDMANRIRKENYSGPFAGDVKQVVVFLNTYFDGLMADNGIPQLLIEIQAGGVTRTTIHDIMETIWDVELDEEDFAEFGTPEAPVLDVVTDDGMKSHDDDEVTSSGVTRDVPEGDFVGAFESGYAHDGMSTYYRAGHELLIKVRDAGDKAKREDIESVRKIVRAAHALGFSQREIAKRLEISRPTVSRILKGIWRNNHTRCGGALDPL